MEAYSSNYSSSSSSMYSSPKAKMSNSLHHSSLLHAVKKSPTKPLKKPAVAPPLPPKPPRVYKVDPVDFRDLVQKLTGATEFQPRRLQSVAPPPLNVNAAPPRVHDHQLQHSTAKTVPPFRAVYPQEMMIMKPQKISDSSSDQEAPFSLGMANIQSPSNSHNWFSFPLLSPGTISSLDQTTYGSLAL